MDAVGKYLDKLSSNFLVAAIIPALAFGFLLALLLLTVQSEESLKSMFINVSPFVLAVLAFSLFIVILAFSLSSLNTFILKLYEGYIFLPRLPWLRRKQQKAAHRLIRKREILKKRISRLKEMEDESETYGINTHRQAYLSRLKDREYALAAEYDRAFPPSLNRILPTRFGNILKAAESYPVTRYGIDAVPMWNRLIHVIPGDYYEKIDRTRNELSFLVNCSLLAALFALISLAFAGVNLLWTQTSARFTQSQLIVIDLLACGISLFIAVVFYRAAMIVVSSFGSMIRSAYDLFRFSLLEQFRLRLPEDSVEERDLWEMLSELMAYYDGENPLSFEYEHKNEAETKPQTILVKILGDG